MEARYLKTLEFMKIKDILALETLTPMGKSLSEDLHPFQEQKELLDSINDTYEGVISLNYGSPPMTELGDITNTISRATKGGILTGKELYIVLRSIQVSKDLKVYFTKIRDLTPKLFAMLKEVDDCKELKESINISVSDEGHILDTASAELKSIRKQIFRGESDLKDKLDSFIRSPQKLKYLQEGIITQRNDRYCIPVKAEHKGQVPGIAHDYSASGATVFVEPNFAVEIANKVQEFKSKEKQEVERILINLTNLLSCFSEELKYINETIGRMDFILAKAKMARKQRATQPRINQDGVITIKKGRHPLIPDKEVVPMSLELGTDFNTLVITGPNTGGKTVTLKTVGLLTLMALSGLFVLGDEGCSFPILEGVYADIGDEQSIEQSLSTFSSHMTNIVNIINKAQKNSLVLFDELGAGTDPVEGSALATAIMNLFKERKVLTVATTHYSQLKSYAYENELVENASVEFDHQTLKPTYKLLVGIPGKSNAFEISQRLGLDTGLIQKAKEMISQDTIRVDEMLKDLEEKRMLYEKKLEELEQNQRLFSLERQTLDKKQAEVIGKKEEILRKAKEESYKIIRLAKREGEELIKDIRKIQESVGSGNIHRDLQKVRDKMKNTTMEEEAPQKTGNLTNKDITVGMEVRLLDINQKATVLGLPDGDSKVLCQVGIMKIKTSLENLEKVQGTNKVTYNRATLRNIKNADDEVKNSLDIRGQNVEDAILEIDKFLDNSFVLGFKEVTIVHGKGTGALRTGVREYLRKHPHVKSTRFGGFSEGGDGASIVTLK
ncbi:endonuclease MutS2 [Alkalicella caledoniensis]|uniref:Endonuclease MutS2 n=1 Tax=Alkalicella caledoniensis TaxID=2731377 RepID=A0A7G9WAJ6_ALKCA|nr:endonuclease MutS2 [Alkalicella caledoniensis]QNO15708.1 endonuclease MutS2 [Alkalicella caledoniensis]